MVPIPPANAQFGGTPGCPNSLLALVAEAGKYAAAIRAVSDEASAQRKPSNPVKTCALFEVYLARDSEFIREMQNNAETCGFTAQAIKAAQENYGKASEASKQICNAPFKWDSAVAPR